MGVYYTLFYGGVIRGNAATRERIQAICDDAGWTLIPDGETIVIDARAASIQVSPTDRFRTENGIVVVHGPDSKHEQVGQAVYDALLSAFAGFPIDPRWLRREFNSGNMTCSYAIEII